MIELNVIASLARQKKPRATDRASVLEAAEKLFRKYGFDAVGMRQIAEAANTNPVQLYRLGLSKSEILGDLIVRLNSRQIRDMKKLDISGLGKTARERILGYLLALYRLDVRDKELRKLGAAYGWLWPREREVEVTNQIAVLVAPVEAELRHEGLDQIESRCQAIWSLYYSGYRAAIIHDATAEQCVERISGAIGLLTLPNGMPDGRSLRQ
jgi:AcrR family transcriptional regulator